MTYTPIPHAWGLFCLCFAVMLVAMYLMGRQSRHFYTLRRPVRRRFSMMDLEFAQSYEEQRLIVQGITRLKGPGEAAQAFGALRAQILTDYLLYMPATYGGIFILCYTLSGRADMGPAGHGFFGVLAFAQVAAFLLDAIENAVFLRIIALRDVPLKDTDANKCRYHRYHRWLQALEFIKWGAAMLGAVCGFSALCYYWLQGAYSGNAWIGPLVLIAEIALYLGISNWVAKKDKAALQEAAAAAAAVTATAAAASVTAEAAAAAAAGTDMAGHKP